MGKREKNGVLVVPDDLHFETKILNKLSSILINIGSNHFSDIFLVITCHPTHYRREYKVSSDSQLNASTML